MRAAYAGFVICGGLLGLAALVWLVTGSALDVAELYDKLGVWGIVLFAAWPLLLTVGVIVTSRPALFRRADANTRDRRGAVRDRRRGT